jgi:hypothetical protein
LIKLRRIAAIAAATAAVTAGLASSAQASVTVGQLAPGSPPPECSEKFDEVQFLFHSGTSYTVPETGVITSWSVNAGPQAGQMMGFKVFHETGTLQFTVVAHDAPRLLNPGINTFKVHIPVKVSDVIGLNTGNASAASPVVCAFVGTEGGSIDDELLGFNAFGGDAPDGSLLTPSGQNPGLRANVSATLLTPPEINIPGRVSLGSIKGGASVVLQGIHFEEVSSVTFGGVPAKSFTTDSDHQITAIAPPGKTLAEIAAAVTTPAGTATSPSRFSYRGCVVPKLKGKKLTVAKAKIKNAGCKVGKIKKVRGSAGKRGKVIQQSPKPGKVSAPGTKVSLKVGA